MEHRPLDPGRGSPPLRRVTIVHLLTALVLLGTSFPGVMAVDLSRVMTRAYRFNP
jgi:hypothetical protein